MRQQESDSRRADLERLLADADRDSMSWEDEVGFPKEHTTVSLRAFVGLQFHMPSPVHKKSQLSPVSMQGCKCHLET